MLRTLTGNLLLRLTCLSVAMVALAVAPSARAAYAGSPVLNGATVSYTSSNKLRVGYGTAIPNQTVDTIDGTFSTTGTLSGVQWGYTSSTACTTGGTASQQAKNMAYYVYYYDGGSHKGFVIASVPPWETGIAQAAMNLSGNCSTQFAGTDFAFVGSYITDSSGNVIPFERLGEQVLFANSTQASNSGTISSTAVSTTWNVGSSGVTSPYPATASGLIIDLQAINSDTKDHILFVADPNRDGEGLSNCSTGTLPSHSAVRLGLYSSTAGASASIGSRAVVSTRGTNPVTPVIAAVCETAWGTGSVVVQEYWAGYVESVHHLSRNTQSCATSADCPTSQGCFVKQCMTSSGQACDISADCISQSCSSNICACDTYGGICVSNADCCTGDVCKVSSGECLVATGYACTLNANCSSDSCVSKICACNNPSGYCNVVGDCCPFPGAGLLCFDQACKLPTGTVNCTTNNQCLTDVCLSYMNGTICYPGQAGDPCLSNADCGNQDCDTTTNTCAAVCSNLYCLVNSDCCSGTCDTSYVCT